MHVKPRKSTLVAAVPIKKKLTSKANGAIHGWAECTTAVTKAAIMPAGVSDFLVHALYTSAAVTAALKAVLIS
jgi:hypothetical protein